MHTELQAVGADAHSELLHREFSNYHVRDWYECVASHDPPLQRGAELARLIWRWQYAHMPTRLDLVT